MIWFAIPASALASYLIGSFPSGYLAGRLCGIDLHTVGSGNVGATNALRVLGKKLGYLVLAADIFKGWLAVMAAFLIGVIFFRGWEFANFPADLMAVPSQVIPFGVLGAICGMLGHIYPVWLKFKGGKGIATSGGVMLALFPIEVFVAGLAAWLVLFFTTRYVSVASLAAAIMLPVASTVMVFFGRCDWLRTGIAALMCLLAVWRHKENIQRLLAGTEKKFEKKPPGRPSGENPHV